MKKTFYDFMVANSNLEIPIFDLYDLKKIHDIFKKFGDNLNIKDLPKTTSLVHRLKIKRVFLGISIKDKNTSYTVDEGKLVRIHDGLSDDLDEVGMGSGTDFRYDEKGRLTDVIWENPFLDSDEVKFKYKKGKVSCSHKPLCEDDFRKVF